VFPVTRDMVDGRVASVEGAMSKNPHNCAQWQRCSSLSSTLHGFFPTFGKFR
jgi:hypothetical protein